jgi:glycine/D-amino acid oxidase-like deaminating enzyme
MSVDSLWQEQCASSGFTGLEGRAMTEVCVIGAGITGVGCALRLLDHGVAVTLVEAREVAGSASGRNGGFAVTRRSLGFSELAARHGHDAAVRLYRGTERAMEELIGVAAELRVPEAIRRTGEVWLADEQEADDLRQAVAASADGGPPCELAPDLVPQPMRGCDLLAAFFPLDGDLQPAQLVRALATSAAERGARIHEHSPASSPVRAGSSWRVPTPDGIVEADTVVVTGDGAIAQLLPELDGIVYPVRGQVLATAPIPGGGPLRHPTHSQHGFMYYRPTPDGRVVVGGGRLEHLEDEYTADEQTTAPVQEQLDRFLADELGLAGVTVTNRWAGIMGFSADLMPLAGPLGGRPGVYVAGGYSGVGNVQGYACGQLVADLVATGHHPDAREVSPARFENRTQPPERQEQSDSRALARTLGLRTPS